MDTFTRYTIYGLIGLVIFLVIGMSTKRPAPFPPGPPADPIVGHLFKIPGLHEHHETFMRWAAQYGDMVYLNVLGQSILIVSSYKVATDLLDKRGANYCDRPRTTSLDLLGWELSLTLIGYGPLWRKCRKMAQEYLAPRKCTDYLPLHVREVNVLLKNLIEKPRQFDWAIQRFATANVIEIAYGHRVESDDDEYVKVGKAAFESLEAGNFGIAPVDLFPFLRHLPQWVPGYSFIAGPVRKYRPAVRRMFDFPFNEVRRQMAEGAARPSFTSTQLERAAQDGSLEDQQVITEIKATASSLYVGAVETMSATTRTFLLALLLYPGVQRRAQEELDRVVGSERLPDYSDRQNLPYIEAIVNETLRWHSVVPLGFPHRSIEDDVYDGMFIPKGTFVLANLLAIQREFHRSPENFYPERFYPEPIGWGETYRVAAFGFGRRRCPGVDFAQNTLWMTFARFLTVFSVSPAVDENGQRIIPEAAFAPNLTSAPEPFDCTITPRSEKHRALAMQQTSD